MATDIIEGLKTREEYLETVQLSYTPVSLAIESQFKHDIAGAETINFRTLDVEKDSVVAENLTAGQTEVAHIKAREGKKTFYKVLKGAKITQSVRNFGFNKIPSLVSKIIRAYSQIFDRFALYGKDGNNGIINTSDPNAIANASVEIDLTATEQTILNSVIKAVSAVKRQVSDNTASQNVLVYMYGSQLLSTLDTVTYNGKNVREALEAAWPEARFIEVPGLVTEGNDQGIVAISQGLVEMNYTKIPTMDDTGYNAENKYFWADFEVGSVMIDVREYGALIKQPMTFKVAAAG